MTSTNLTSTAAALILGFLFLGCSAEPIEGTTELSVYGLTKGQTITACSERILDVASTSSDPASATFTWNVTAPSGAAYVATPSGEELRFNARTPGAYLITVTACPTEISNADDCAVTEFAVDVAVGQDSNANGIGDACESTSCVPACEGRTCGTDPVCEQSCGTCGIGQSCDKAAGQCKAACVPACDGRTCGTDPVCGQSCGTCGAGQTCDEAKGQCQAACVPACDGRTCGVDPICHTSCGTCTDASSCNADGKCEAKVAAGRVVTIVMSLTDRRLAYTDPYFRQRAKLIEQSVRWASPVGNPKVLVVLDDSSAVWLHEAGLIKTTLKKSGLKVTLMNEPVSGLLASQVAGYDVVWFSNPVLPVDDALTIATMLTFARNGGGLVLQGDDITQPKSLEPLTRLANVSTGKDYCGLHIDDDRGPSYRVTVEHETHPVVSGLRHNTYYYGDDIDGSNFLPLPGADVLAWADVPTCRQATKTLGKCPKQPVVVANDMSK